MKYEYNFQTSVTHQLVVDAVPQIQHTCVCRCQRLSDISFVELDVFLLLIQCSIVSQV